MEVPQFKQAPDEILELVASLLIIIKLLKASEFTDEGIVMVGRVQGLLIQVFIFGLIFPVLAVGHSLSLVA